MTVRLLTNALWGFDSSCFVCDESNPLGLRIPFFHDLEASTVTCEFRLGPAYSGAPRFVHGGIILAVLDEAMAWATIAVAERFAVTKETTTRFERPVRVDHDYHAVARVTEQQRAHLRARAELFDDRERRRAWAEATFTILSARAAKAAIGTLTADSTPYLRSGTPDQATADGAPGPAGEPGPDAAPDDSADGPAARPGPTPPAPHRRG